MMAGEQATVSVIVPTHNRAAYLRRALLSIRAQTWQHMQVIVIANGCIDDTAQVAREFQRQVETQDASGIEFVYQSHDESLGGARARNLGLERARGEYIAFLDDDDYWHAHKLAAQVDLIHRHGCALVGCAHYDLFGAFGDEQIRPAGIAADESTELRFDDLACENKLGGFSHCLTRRSTLGDARIDESLHALQDWDLWLKILTPGGHARISQRRHVFYRIDGDGERISANTAQVAAAQQRFLQLWRARFDEPSIAYHEMRNRCFSIKSRAGEQNLFGMMANRFCAIANWPRTVKTILQSAERANIKRCLHYMFFPLIDIDAMRMRMWRISGKQRAHKTVAGGE